MLRLLTLSVAVAATTLAATGCGAADPADAHARSVVDDVRRIHHAWLTRLAAGDTTACDLLTQEARLRLVNGHDGACFMYVDRFADSITPEQRAAFGKVHVRRVRMQRNNATIYDSNLILLPELADLDLINAKPMHLRRADGLWRIDQIG